MALTTQEEALVRQLLDQQAAILSLAGNEATITSKLGATKVTLADLVAASSMSDSDLLLTRQGTTDKSASATLLRGYMQSGMATQLGVQDGSYNTASAAGSSDAITASFSPAVTSLRNGFTVYVRAAAANTSASPTFSPDGLPAKTIGKGNNLPLVAGDIAGAGHWIELQYDATLDKWILLNPAIGVSPPTVPSGTVIYVARNTPPTGYLKADGAAVSRTTYAALFAAIGTTFGAGDGSTTFNLPDLRGEFVRGWDNGRGADPNRAFGSWQVATAFMGDGDGSQIPIPNLNDATHAQVLGFDLDTAPQNTTGITLKWSNSADTRSGLTGMHTSGGASIAVDFARVRPRNVALLACIRY